MTQSFLSNISIKNGFLPNISFPREEDKVNKEVFGVIKTKLKKKWFSTQVYYPSFWSDKKKVFQL
jgi:hypothetical protein